MVWIDLWVWVDSMALGCGCGLIDLVVGCSGLLWVVLWIEAVGCVMC